jgi:hypothetical protein
VPAAIAVNTPVDADMVPTAEADELHVPPPGDEVSAVVLPTHAVKVPVIVAGAELIVTDLIDRQPEGSI